MGAILNRAKPAEEIKRGTAKLEAALGGKSGSGKTVSAALTLPGKKLLLDYDDRSESVAGYPDIKIIKILETPGQLGQAWRTSEALVDELWAQHRAGTLEYDAIIEDGLSKMNRICMNWALLLDSKRGLGGSPAQQHYGPQMHNLASHIDKMKNLPVHYVLTLHLELFEDAEQGSHLFLPKMYGKTRTELGSWFNECYYCYHKSDKEGKQRWYWHTAGFGRMDFFKSAMNMPSGKFWEDPIEINLNETPAGFMKLLDLRYGKEVKDVQS